MLSLSQASAAASRRGLLRAGANTPLAARRCLSTSSVLSRPASQRQSSPLVQSTTATSAARSVAPRSALLTQQARLFHASHAASAETVKVPQMAESISEGTLKQWSKKKGDFVNADEEVATIETDKIDVTVNAPQSGTIVELLADEEDTVTVGQDLFKIEPGEGPSGGESSSSGGEKEESQPKKDEGGKKDEGSKKDEGGSSKKKDQEDTKKKEESQQAEKQKKEQNSPSEQQKDDKKPPSQGKKDDKPSPPPKKESSPSSSSPSESSKPAAGSRGEHRVKMNRMRLRISERLKQSQNTAASLTTFNEIDMSGLMAFRARHKDRLLKEQGIKLGFMGAFTKACALALKEIPAANASIEGDGLGDTIVYRDYVDISVAVSTGKGLVTPVIRNVESMSIMEIENEIAELGKKARDNKLTLEDMTGGSFTISNGGVFGSLFGTPILNAPQSAILGMHAIKEKPWVVTDEAGKKSVGIRPIQVVALTYDHRLLDGREAVTFLVKLKQYIEDMGSMLL